MSRTRRQDAQGQEGVFPARAGMSRVRRGQTSDTQSVPRASGAEPAKKRVRKYEKKCSPRERG